MSVTSSSSPRSSRAYPWVLVAALWCVCFLNYADRQAISSLLPLLKSNFSLSQFQVGVVASAFMWMYAVAGPAAGWLGDRLSRRTLILTGLVLWIALEFAAALAHSYPSLVLVRGFSGLGEAFYFPSALALLSMWHGPATRSRALAVHQSAVYIGSIAGGFAGGLFSQHGVWRESFLFFGVLGVALLLPLSAVLRQSGTTDAKVVVDAVKRPSLWQAAGQLSRVRGVRLLFAVFMGANFVAMALTTWLPFYLYSRFHWSISAAGLGGALYLQSASVVGVLCGGSLADRLFGRVRCNRILTQTVGLLAGSVFLLVIGAAQSLWPILAGMIGFGFCKGIYDSNIFAALYDVVPEDLRSSATGLMNSAGWVGGGFAPILIGLSAAHFGLGLSLGATAFIYLPLGLVMLFASRNPDVVL